MAHEGSQGQTGRDNTTAAQRAAAGDALSCSHSVQPGMTRFSGNEVGSPRGIDESKSCPSVVQPDACYV